MQRDDYLSSTIVISSPTTVDGTGQKIGISGNHTVRIFAISPGATFGLNNLTIANANSGGTLFNRNGGGIFNLAGTVVATNRTFSGNSASYGERTLPTDTTAVPLGASAALLGAEEIDGQHSDQPSYQWTLNLRRRDNARVVEAEAPTQVEEENKATSLIVWAAYGHCRSGQDGITGRASKMAAVGERRSFHR